MGLREKLFGKKSDVNTYARFETITEKNPVFAQPFYAKDMYEQTLVRSIIERIAMAVSKLEPHIEGSARPKIAQAVATDPNSYQTWPQFLARCATIYYNDTNLFIAPEYDEITGAIIGIFPIECKYAELVDFNGEPWLRFHLLTGKTLAFELSEICILTRFQRGSDIFGGGNRLESTLKLIEAQERAQNEAIKNGAAIKWIGALNGMVREEDMEKKRERFREQNLDASNTSGLMVYDATFNNLQQVTPQSWTISTEEMQRIERNLFFYFGINEDILLNDYDENKWDAFYEGIIEFFAIMLGEGVSHMLYTRRERLTNKITFSANRLAYSSAATKRNMNKDMLDRGIFTINDALETLQMPTIGPDGDVRILRGEYKVGRTIQEILAAQTAQMQADTGIQDATVLEDTDAGGADGKDGLRGDSEGYGSAGDTDTGDVQQTKQ